MSAHLSSIVFSFTQIHYRPYSTDTYAATPTMHPHLHQPHHQSHPPPNSHPSTASGRGHTHGGTAAGGAVPLFASGAAAAGRWPSAADAELDEEWDDLLGEADINRSGDVGSSASPDQQISSLQRQMHAMAALLVKSHKVGEVVEECPCHVGSVFGA